MRAFDRISVNLERNSGWFSPLSPLGICLRLLVVLTFIFGAVGFFDAWYLKATSTNNPQNVTEKWQFAHEFDKSLDTITINWCNAVKTKDETIGNNSIEQSLARAYLTEYNLVKAQYNARLNDAFEAKLIVPPNIPHSAPTLARNIIKLGLNDCPIS